MTDLLDKKTDQELVESMLAEVAKAHNEVDCARRDVTKAERRLSFLVMLANKLIDRHKD